MIRLKAIWLTASYALLPAMLSSLTACNDKDAPAAEVRSSAQSTVLSKLSQVPNFSLTDEDGNPFGSKQLKGAPYVAAFMCTRCPTICPELTARMKQVRDVTLASGATLQLVSISVDPENDTPEVLKAY